jgi:UrcA family protein
MFSSHPSTVRALIALALSVMFLFARPAQAIISASDSRSVTVSYHDLNLDAPGAVRTLYTRIQAAAVTVCTLPDDGRPGDRAFLVERDHCVNHAVARAVLAVGNNKLSAYHWQRITVWKHGSGEGAVALNSGLTLDSATPCG